MVFDKIKALDGKLKSMQAEAQAGGTFQDVMRPNSMLVSLANETSETLYLPSSGLGSGIWATQPTQTLKPGKTMTFQSTGDGGGKGTAGHVHYDIGATREKLFIDWNNPYVGDNTNRVRIDNENRFRWTTEDGWGDRATYWVTISKCLTFFVTADDG